MSLAEEVQKIMDTTIQGATTPVVEDRLGKRLAEDHLKGLHASVDGLRQVVVLLAQEIDTLKGTESKLTLN